jgi:hypothetical protein
MVAHSYDDEYDATCNNCDFVRDAACRHDNKVAIGEAKSPTCTADGITAGEKCAKCGEVITAQETIDKLGHDIVTDSAKAPTCVDTGLTEGSHCSRCNDATVAQQTVSALGHSYDSGVVTTKPTTTAEGVKTYTCIRCPDHYTETIAKLIEINFEAENGTVVNGSKTLTGTVKDYASGKAFVANLKKDGTITITIPSEIDTIANLIFVMSSYEDALDESGNKLDSTMALKINEYLTFSINGQIITVGDDAILPGGADDERGKNSRFAHWYELVLENVDLKAGDNTFVITSLVDMSNDNKDDLHSTIFDVLKVQYTDYKAIKPLESTTVYQAEKQKISGISTTIKSAGATSGLFNNWVDKTDPDPGFAKDFTKGSTITLTIVAPEATKVKISLWGSSTSGTAVTTAALINKFEINGAALTYNTGNCFPGISPANAANMANFKEFVLGEYELSEGVNTVVITFNATSACFLDRIVVTTVEE